VRAGFALRHAGKLGAVWAGAELAKLAWERPVPGSLATLPRYERGMLWPRRRIKARGYSPRWQPRYMPQLHWYQIPWVLQKISPEEIFEISHKFVKLKKLSLDDVFRILKSVS
jgi:hypothetical protein